MKEILYTMNEEIDGNEQRTDQTTSSEGHLHWPRHRHWASGDVKSL